MAVVVVPFQGALQEIRFERSERRDFPIFALPWSLTYEGSADVVGQVFRLDFPSPAEHKSMLDRVLQLAHVTGVAVSHEKAERIIRDARYLLVLETVESSDEMLDQERDIFHPFSKSRQAYADDIDPEVQVFPKSPLPHQLFEISIRRGDHPDIRFR
jgi:hypothetical protein